MSAGTSYRVVIAGAELRMLVLANEPGGSIGVDLDSGCFVRPEHAPCPEPAAPFDVVTGEIAGSVEPPDAARPEAVELAGAPRRVGRLSPRRAERLLAPLRHPAQLPLLGMGPGAVPYWTLEGDRPSLALVEPRGGPRLAWGPTGLECRFWWGGEYELPVTDELLAARADTYGLEVPLRRLVGFRPRRLLVVLTRPVDGYCQKAVAALLPGGH